MRETEQGREIGRNGGRKEKVEEVGVGREREEYWRKEGMKERRSNKRKERKRRAVR